jgi:predicted ATPase
MGALMRAISRPERPVVWLLDDLQWARGCPFEILHNLVTDELNDSFMFMGITRSDVGPNDSVSKFLRRIEDQGIRISNISLSNLVLEDIQNMVEDSFSMPQKQALSLAAFFHENSSGNPFFVTNFIRTVQKEHRFLDYDKETNKWTVSPTNLDCYMTSCPIDLVQRKLESYPREDKKVLMVVACLGSHSTQRMIEVALQEDATESLMKLTKNGKLVHNEKDGTYTIKYNVVKNAAYKLIGDTLQPAFHVEIGLRLMKYLDQKELEENMYCVLSQLDHGKTLLLDQKVKYDIAALLVHAAEKSAGDFTFHAVHMWLKRAYDLLGPNHWEEAYDLTLVLYNYLAEIEFAVEDNDRVDFLLDEIEKHSRVCYDRLRSFTTRVHILGVRGQPDAAIERGAKILSCLGVKLPTHPGKVKTIWAVLRMDRRLKGKSDEMLLRLPKMTDDIHLACMQVLNLLLMDTFLHRNKLFPFVILKMLKLSLDNGLSAMSSVAFAGYGVLLTFSGHTEEGQRFGKLALELVDQFGASAFRARVMALVYGCIQNSVKPWIDSLDHLKEGHRLGLMTGDFEFAMFNSNLRVACMLESGRFHIEDTKSDLQEMIHLTESYGHFQQVSSKLGIILPVDWISGVAGLLSHGVAFSFLHHSWVLCVRSRLL